MRLIEKDSHTEKGLKFTTPNKLTANYFTQFRLQNIAVVYKTLFRRIENYHTLETSSLTKKVRDDEGETTTKETTRIFLKRWCTTKEWRN